MEATETISSSSRKRGPNNGGRTFLTTDYGRRARLLWGCGFLEFYPESVDESLISGYPSSTFTVQYVQTRAIAF